MKILNKMKRRGGEVLRSLIMMAAIMLIPFFSQAASYDPGARLVSLQSTYPGGVEALYIFCSHQESEKLNYLQNLGVVLSEEALSQESYSFLSICIYGRRDYQESVCALGAENCTAVNLPLDLSTLKQLSGVAKVSNPMPPSQSNNLTTNLY